MTLTVLICGGGLVGSLAAIRFQESFPDAKVLIYEKRKDSRLAQIGAGKSINLALSRRGLKALGPELGKKIKEIGVKMPRRIIHNVDESILYQNYGKDRSEHLLSVSRQGLNEMLLTEAEKLGCETFFGFKCIGIDLRNSIGRFTKCSHDDPNFHVTSVKADLIVGADGIFSSVRTQMSKFLRMDFEQKYITHGYIELCIPATENSDWAMKESLQGGKEENDEDLVHGLHIWPRKDFMLIALPNKDKSYTVTLFCRFETKGSDKPGFDAFKTDEDFVKFFQTNFPDAIKVMPSLIQDYHDWKPSGLCTVRCDPHTFGDNVILFGDSAHAVVPFYGQGVNSGFQSVYKYFKWLKENNNDWRKTVMEYSPKRVKDCFTIRKLALDHFDDMKANTTSELYFRIKKFEEDLLAQLGDKKFCPLYTMVTFRTISYAKALQKSEHQSKLIQNVINKHESLFRSVYADGNDDGKSTLIEAYVKELEANPLN